MSNLHATTFDMIMKANTHLLEVVSNMSASSMTAQSKTIVRMGEHIVEAMTVLYQAADYFGAAESLAAFWGYSKTLVS